MRTLSLYYLLTLYQWLTLDAVDIVYFAFASQQLNTLYSRAIILNYTHFLFVLFSFNSGKVVVLRVSIDGAILTSGSDDNTLKVWNISSRQCIRSINYKGIVDDRLSLSLSSPICNYSVSPPSRVGPVVNISIDLKKNKSKNVNVSIAKIFNRNLKKTGTITSLLAEGCKKGDLKVSVPSAPLEVIV